MTGLSRVTERPPWNRQPAGSLSWETRCELFCQAGECICPMILFATSINSGYGEHCEMIPAAESGRRPCCSPGRPRCSGERRFSTIRSPCQSPKASLSPSARAPFSILRMARQGRAVRARFGHRNTPGHGNDCTEPREGDPLLHIDPSILLLDRCHAAS